MNVLSREKIFKLLKRNKRKLREFYVKRIGLFGSVLRNEQINKSDIDFIVEFIEGKKNYNNFIGLAFFLEDLFKRKVDLLTIEGLSPYMKSKILKEAYFEAI